MRRPDATAAWTSSSTMPALPLGDFLETIPLEDFEWLMGINFWGVVYGTMAFLPHLKKRPEGHIVNISSINGIMPNPNNGPYCAAKFAVKGYTETLAQEMHGTSINVSCVHPGGIKTNIARNARVNRAMFDLTREKGENIYEEVALPDHGGRCGKDHHLRHQAQQKAHSGGSGCKGTGSAHPIFSGDRRNLEQCVQQADCPKIRQQIIN